MVGQISRNHYTVAYLIARGAMSRVGRVEQVLRPATEEAAGCAGREEPEGGPGWEGWIAVEPAR